MRRRPRADWSADAPFRFAVGIEDTFIPHEYAGRRKLDEYELTQHYQFWETDLTLAAEAGADSIRWGIPWYRVEPEPGVFHWNWVDRVVDRMAELGLSCIVDLMHYGTPLWLENTFLHPDYPARVADYAAAAAARYGDQLHMWTPLNEPVINAVYCGERGTWPPHLTGQSGFVSVLLPVAEGMVRTQQAIEAVQPDATFVHVDAGFRWQNASASGPPLDVLEERRFLALDLITGRVGDQHPLLEWLLRNGADEQRLAALRDRAVSPDVIGVNYYPAFTTARFDGDRELPVEAGTAGLEDLVRLYSDRYGRPLMVTETSRGGTIEERLAWLGESLAAVARLRSEGVPLRGYTWFPFTALVDWLYRQDTRPVEDWLVQMGLVDLRLLPGSGVLERVRTPLVDRFRDAATAGVDTDTKGVP